MRNLSSAIDVAVQARAEITCPIWAPIKFFLIVSNFHATVTEQITTMIQTIADNLPRFELYKKLQADPSLQVALLNIFSDIVEFCVVSYKHFSRHSLVQLWKLVTSPLKEDFQATIDRLKMHSRIVDETAVAIELVRASQFRNEEVRLKCQFWLSPANMNQVQESRFSMKLEGTCEWFWSHQTVEVWTAEQGPASRDRLLCVSGKSGCGKSILASSVVKALRERHQRAIFFSFSGTDASRATLNDLVRSLLWQVLDDPDEEAGLHLIRDLMAHGQPTTTDLWNVLNKVVEKTANELYWVVDGVDECSGSVSVMFDRINELLTRSKASKAIVLGRPHALEATKVSGHSIDIDSHLIQSDLHSYISAKVEQNQGLQKLGINYIVLNTLLEKSEGMFLWAKLMVEELSSASSVKEVIHKIHHQPRGLKAVYRRILLQLRQNLDDFEVGLAQKLLAFIIAAGRPLTVEELNYAQALALRAEDESLTRSTIEDSLHMDAIQKIRRVCGGLVDIKDDKVSLVHVTAKEFLLRPVEEWSDHDTTIISFHLCMNDSHEVIGLSCLDHLSLFGTTLRQANEATNPTNDNPNRPFLLYAADFAIYHFNRANVCDSETITRIRKTMMSDGCVRWMEYVLVLILDDRSAHTSLIILDELRRSLTEDSLRLGNFNQFMPLVTRQLAQRRQEIGENDWRTQQLQTLLRIIAHEGSDIPPPGQKSVTVHSASQGRWPHEPENTMELVEMLRKHNMVPMQTRVELLLKLTNIAQSVSTLTDSLEILFRLIMRNAVGMPVLILMMVGNFYHRFNKPRKALEVFVIALKKNRDGEMVSRAEILELIGRCHYDIKEFGEAATAFSEAVTDSRTKMGPRNEDTGRLLHWHGRALYMLEDYAAAKEFFQQALSIRQKLYQSPHENIADSIYWHGRALYKLEDYAAAREVFNQELSIWQELHQSPHEYIADSIYWHGRALYMLKDYTAAKEVFQRALSIRQELHQSPHEDIADSIYWHGRALYELEDYAAAQEVFNKELSIRQELHQSPHEYIADSMYWHGRSLYELEDDTAAKEVFQQALSIWQELHQSPHLNTACSMYWYGRTLYELEDYAAAREVFQQALSIRQELHQSPHLETARSMYWMGLAMCRATEYANAEKVIAEAHVMFRGLRQGDHEDIAASLDWQGIVFYGQSRLSEAERMFQESIAIERRLHQGDHLDISTDLDWLGLIYTVVGRLTEAEAAFEESLSMQIRLLGPDHPDVAIIAHHLGVIRQKLDKFAEAKAALRQAGSVRKRAQPESRISVGL